MTAPVARGRPRRSTTLASRSERRPQDRTPAVVPRALRVLFVVVVLYAAFGKGFAYAGWPPVFVGEVALVLLALAVVRPAMALPSNAASVVTVALAALALVQLAIDRIVGVDPLLESLRGLAPVYYSAYAFITYALLRRCEARSGYQETLQSVDQAVARVTPAVLGVLLVLAVLLVYSPAAVPTWPGSGVSMLITGSSISVTLVLCLPFLNAERRGRKPWVGREVLAAMWLVTAVLLVFRSRGALVGLAAGAFALRPRPVRVTKALLAVTAALLVLYVSGAAIRVSDREVSFRAAVASTASVLGASDDDELGRSFVGTRTWRSEWWDDIWSDVTGELMLFHGHGWGDNLAVRYDVVPPGLADDPRVLRLPHSLFFSIAGRAGIVMAIGFFLVPALTLGRTYARLRAPVPRIAEAARGGIVAALVVSLADIFVEAPQGGIVVWTMLGFLWWITASHPNPSPMGSDVEQRSSAAPARVKRSDRG